jgi:hypothetical protein
MLSTFLELKEVLIYISKNTSNLEYNRIFLNSKEWAEIEELKRIFEVFLKPSIKLQGQTYTTLSQSLFYIYLIYKDLEVLQASYSIDYNLVSFFLFFFN